MLIRSRKSHEQLFFFSSLMQDDVVEAFARTWVFSVRFFSPGYRDPEKKIKKESNAVAHDHDDVNGQT